MPSARAAFFMSKKGWEERQWEKVAEQEYSENLKDPSRITGVKKGAKRFVHEAIPSNAIQWIKKNHAALEGAYINYVGKQAHFLNNAASFLSEEFGIDLHKEHPISVSGAGDVELSPTTAMSDRGPNDQGFSGNARFNRRLNSKNAFLRGDLDELGVASNWQYSAANFVADRPDIKDAGLRAELGLKPLGPKVSNLGMLKLQQGDLNIDTLQMKMFIEQDLKNSGFELDVDQKARLGAYFKDLESKEMVINAEKHSWKVDKYGNKVLDAQGRPIPTGDWDLKNKFKYDNPTGSEQLARRTADAQNAVKRQNPEFTKLPSQAVKTAGGMFKELTNIGGKKLFREVVRKMGGSNNVIANISGDIIGTVMDGVTYAQTKDKKALTDLCLSGSQALTSLGALGIACLPIPGARPGAFALMKVGDNIASVERIYNLMGGTSTIDRLLKNGMQPKTNKKLLETPTTRTKIKV